MNPTFANSMLIATVILMDLLTGVEFDLFVPSFPELQTQFNLTPFWVEALLSVNFIGYCLSLFFVGGLADRYGRKPIIVLGLVVFVVGSVLCLGMGSYEWLLLGRFLQGVGIAAPGILSFLIIADRYSLKKQQFLMAMLNGSMNAAAGVAPVMGSYITMYFHWQGNFTVLLYLGLFTLVMTLCFIPSYPLPAQKEMISLRAYSALFQSRPLLLAMVSILFLYVPYWIFVGMSPLLYMKDLGVSLAHFGYYQGVLALVFAIGCVIYGFIIKHINYDQKAMLSLSLIIFVASFLFMLGVTATNSSSALIITLAMLLFVIAQIIPTTILYPLTLNFMPQAKGRVSAVIQGGRLIFAALSLQIAGYVYQGSFQQIGIIITSFIVVAALTLFGVTRHRELMASEK